MADIILTGIPRAGTTLAAALIDSLPDTVCLNEPGWHNAKAASDAKGFVEFLQNDFTNIRKYLLAGEPIPDRRKKNGEAITNYYATGNDGVMHEEFSLVPFTRPNLSVDFTLAIKHNGPYLAVLPELVASGYRIIAIIRDPLPVIRSWRRLSLPISRGDLPNAKLFWPELKQVIDSNAELLEKQVRIYALMHERLMQYRDQITVLRYEEIVRNPQVLATACVKQNASLPSLVTSATAEEPGAEDEAILAMIKRIMPS